MSDARTIATNQLIAIYKAAGPGTNAQTEAVLALGRVGGVEAAKALVSIFKSAGPGTKKQIAAIKALGEVGRDGS